MVWFMTVIVIFYGTILVFYINVQEVVQISESIVSKKYVISSAAKKMMENLLSMEENKQKYLLLKKDDYLSFFNKAQQSFEENLSQVMRLSTMDDKTSTGWRTIGDEYGNYPDAETLSDLLASKQRAPQVVNKFFIPEPTINQWISRISEERAKNEQDIEQTTRELNRKGRASAKHGLIGLAISSIVGLLGMFYLSYSMIRPLRELMVGIRQISSNAPGTPIVVRSRDEFGELAHAVNEMSNHLRREERMRSDFISMLSHEIRTPLTSIRESVNMIREEVMGPINTRQQKFLEIAESEITRISDLLNHLMQASRLEPGMLEMEMEPIDPQAYVAECINSIKLAAETKQIDLSFSPPKQIPMINGDRKQLQQALLNYLSNAVKFSDPETRVVVEIRHEVSRKRISISVADNGPGILEEDLAFLFNKYYRGQRERERLEGVGLGLSIVKNIVESHKGSVWVKSELGKGSTFGFSLPVLEDD